MPNPDVLIIGGGGAGLWLLDELRRGGYSALLVERDALGAGQTIAAQGIIHGGLKYTLDGALHSSARAIREMPALWRSCLSGDCQPDLSAVTVSSDRCHLWRTSSILSQAGMVGARVGLRSQVAAVSTGDRPEALTRCPGDVFSIDEPVIDTGSLIRALADRNSTSMVRADVADFRVKHGHVESVTIRSATRGDAIELQPRHVVLTAGAGNAAIRAAIGLPGNVMQRRPLHMVMVRGPLPPLFGHCVDAARTRVTITSALYGPNRCVWHVGGQIAEDGVGLTTDELIRRAARELQSVLPAVDLSECEWATYRIDRAEGRTPDDGRPSGPQVVVDGNVITAWPTKLALVPELAKLIVDALAPPAVPRDEPAVIPDDWPRPDVALPPWEVPQAWVRAICR
ncbi:MAG: FAD-dependent oxidoreductase [Phycisphaerales bacterium]|nr:FAD-dependent oxidoreductase [Phycisphaerales bacterium]